MIGTIVICLIIVGFAILAAMFLQFVFKIPILYFQPKLNDFIKRYGEVRKLTFKIKMTLLGKIIHGKNEEYLNYVKDTADFWRYKDSGELVNFDDYPLTRQKLDAVEFKIINDKKYEQL